MSAPEMNQKIPDCEVKATSDRNFKLYDLKGKNSSSIFTPKTAPPAARLKGGISAVLINSFKKIIVTSLVSQGTA